MSRINTGSFMPWSSVNCAPGQTLTSEWISTSRASELQAYLLLSSETGSPKHTLTIHYSSRNFSEMNAITATTADYVSITLVSASVSEVMQQFDKTDIGDLAYPPRSIRLSISGAPGDASEDSMVTCYVLWKE